MTGGGVTGGGVTGGGTSGESLDELPHAPTSTITAAASGARIFERLLLEIEIIFTPHHVRPESVIAAYPHRAAETSPLQSEFGGDVIANPLEYSMSRPKAKP